MGKVARRAARDVARDAAVSVAGGGVADWLSVEGYSALFETQAPSVLTPVTSFPGDVASWTDSTGDYTATTEAGTRPQFPYGTLANGIEGLDFTGSGDREIDVAIALPSTVSWALFFVLHLTDSGFAVWGASSDGSAEDIRGGVNASRQPFVGISGSFNAANAALSLNTLSRVMYAYDHVAEEVILRAEGAGEETASVSPGSFAGQEVRFGSRYGASAQYRGGLWCIPVYGGSSILPAADREQVWSDLGARFGL